LAGGLGTPEVRHLAGLVLIRSSGHSLEGDARQPVAAGEEQECVRLLARSIDYSLSRSVFLQVYITPSTLHTASINSIAWAPHDLGLILAVGSSDGTISILEYSATAAAWTNVKVSRTFHASRPVDVVVPGRSLCIINRPCSFPARMQSGSPLCHGRLRSPPVLSSHQKRPGRWLSVL
jgi:hypothetical protein